VAGDNLTNELGGKPSNQRGDTSHRRGGTRKLRIMSSMSSLRTMRRILPLVLALSVGLWAQCGLAMLSAATHTPQCHAAMSHAHHAVAAMACCPSHSASAVFDPPPCCDLSSQPARPLASAAVPGKLRSGQFSARGTAGAAFVLQHFSAFLTVADSPPFVKPVFDLKTDLRI
jgi:hypothetical protein